MTHVGETLYDFFSRLHQRQNGIHNKLSITRYLHLQCVECVVFSSMTSSIKVTQKEEMRATGVPKWMVSCAIHHWKWLLRWHRFGKHPQSTSLCKFIQFSVNSQRNHLTIQENSGTNTINTTPNYVSFLAGANCCSSRNHGVYYGVWPWSTRRDPWGIGVICDHPMGEKAILFDCIWEKMPESRRI